MCVHRPNGPAWGLWPGLFGPNWPIVGCECLLQRRDPESWLLCTPLPSLPRPFGGPSRRSFLPKMRAPPHAKISLRCAAAVAVGLRRLPQRQHRDGKRHRHAGLHGLDSDAPLSQMDGRHRIGCPRRARDEYPLTRTERPESGNGGCHWKRLPSVRRPRGKERLARGGAHLVGMPKRPNGFRHSAHLHAEPSLYFCRSNP